MESPVIVKYPPTYGEFLKVLAELIVQRNWTLNEKGEIRATRITGHEDCPITACSDVVPHWNFYQNGYHLDVFSAADNLPGHDSKIRAELLAACGLS